MRSDFECSVEKVDALLEALDLSRPELLSVRDAWEKRDIAAARRAFARHLRERNTPHWHFDPSEPPRTISAQQQQTADDAVEHRFTSISLAHQFGEEIDWSFDATSLPTSPLAVNHEWTWQLNRHSAWVALAVAYNATGEAKYARELTRQIRGWVQRCPPPVDCADQSPRSRWRTIEAGIRMLGAWPQIFFRMVRQADVFDDETLLVMVESMRQHALYLDRFVTARNWKAMESNGLFHVGVIFPEFRDAAQWREHAMARQFEEVTEQVYPDGVQIELTPHYHNVSLNNFARTLSLARLNGVPLPAGYAEALEGQYDMNLWAMMPDRTTPNFNDSGRDDCVAWLREGLRLFPHRRDWLWIVSEGAEGEAPDHASHLFGHAGWAIMRSGWEREACCLAMQVGPFGAAHQHEGKLNFIIDAFGVPLVCEGGIFTYDASIMRRYVLSAAAHNVVSVDAMEQNRRGGPSDRFVRTTAAPLQWRSTPRFDFVDATYGEDADERWGEGRASGVLHRRQVLFVKPDYWIVVDTLTPEDRRVHRYESIFHLDADEAVMGDCKRITAQGSAGVRLAVIPVEEHDLTVSIIQGEREPYQGWIAETLYEMRAVPTIRFQREGCGEMRFIYAFAPAPAGKPCPVQGIHRIVGESSGTALSLAVELTGGQAADRITIGADGAVQLTREQ